MTIKGLISGEDAPSTARRKARYGRKTWVLWKGRDGVIYAAPASMEAYKAALLAVGTKGRFAFYPASDSCPHSAGWQVGLIMFKNARAGYIF